jgi:hypothetical protein
MKIIEIVGGEYQSIEETRGRGRDGFQPQLERKSCGGDIGQYWTR